MSISIPLMLVFGLSLASFAGAEEKQTNRPWMGPDDAALPFETHEEVLEYLRKARVVSKKPISTGTNRPFKLKLERRGVRAHAIFRTVDVRRKRVEMDGTIYLDFHDSYKYEEAAYRLSRLLGLDTVPPCVERRFEGKDGSIQLWVENAMMEKSRRSEGAKVPEKVVWPRQRQTMRLFDALISNFDRNQDNMLVDAGWKLWFIDHTRSFRKTIEIEGIERIVWCDRDVWSRLRTLDKARLRKAVGGLLDPSQIKALLERRDRLVAHIGQRIEEHGEGAVLFPSTSTGGLVDRDLAEAADDIPLESPMPNPLSKNLH